jgi:hypothetical protein
MRLWKGPTMSKPHSIRYIKQLMEWGFDKEFIARDAGINVESLMTRLRRAIEIILSTDQSRKGSAMGINLWN